MIRDIKHKCETCPFFLQPAMIEKSGRGVCIYDPPRPFITGMTPAGGPLLDPSKPQQVAHVVHAYFPPMSQQEGCGRHPEFVREMMTTHASRLN